jgi:hypothetical protein
VAPWAPAETVSGGEPDGALDRSEGEAEGRLRDNGSGPCTKSGPCRDYSVALAAEPTRHCVALAAADD